MSGSPSFQTLELPVRKQNSIAEAYQALTGIYFVGGTGATGFTGTTGFTGATGATGEEAVYSCQSVSEITRVVSVACHLRLA